MKKTLLLGAAVALGISAFAQGNRHAASTQKTLNKSLNNAVHEPSFPSKQNNQTKLRNSQPHTNAVCGPIWMGSAPNVLTIGGGVTTYKQGCLTYNQTLNTYAWTHRRSAGYASAFPPMSSGTIQMNWINATSQVMDSTIIFYDPNTTNPGRYPTGVIYTPTGTTTVAGSSAVASGPDLFGNGGFNGTWFNNRILTGTATDHTVFPTADQNSMTAPNATTGTSQFMNVDMQQVGTRVLVGGEAADTTTSTATDHNTSFGGIIGHCDFTSGSGVWGHDSIIPGYFYDGSATGLGYGAQGDSRLAFFGNTGYWVDLGRLSNTFGNSADSMLAPIVYKTTDGGMTWNRVLDGYDWRCKHPELMKNVGLLMSTPQRHFTLNFKHGIDVTVDANGALHIAATMVNMVSDGAHTDSAAVYSMTYTHDYNVGRPIIWDLMTDGTTGMGWKTMLVDSIMTSYVGSDPTSDTTASFNPISDGASGFYPYGARLQVTRSTDGTKLFYTWADSDPNITSTLYNSAPDIMLKGYDVTSNKLTATSNITNTTTATGLCFYHVSADKAFFDGTNYRVPFVYTIPEQQPTPGVYNGLSVSDHFYVDCGSVNPATDFVVPATWNGENMTYCFVGVQSHNAFANSVSNYPNPFNNTTNIVVSLGDAKAISVNVYDALGNVVFTKNVNGNVGQNTITFDGSSLGAGVYYYTVTAGYDKVTKKMVIQK